MDRQYTTDGIVRYIKLDDVPLADALKALTGPLNLAFSLQPDFIWITSTAQMAKDEFADPPVPANSAELGTKLQQRINIEFEGTHVRNIVEFISDYLSVNFVLDQRAVPPPGEKGRQNVPYLKKWATSTFRRKCALRQSR